MAGVKGRSGRRRQPGRLYRFSLRYRPGLDPPALEALLEAVAAARGGRRAEILRAALLGGAAQAQARAAAAEDAEAATLVDGILAAF
jgi:hypothetical protein